jgi:F0F1-type ATP synthase membrane subunit b/b'
MRDAVEKVLRAEAEAKRVLESAKTEAEQLRGQADRDAGQWVERVRQETKEEAARMVAAALERAREEKDTRLADAAERIGREVSLSQDDRRRFALAVARSVREVPEVGPGMESGA